MSATFMLDLVTPEKSLISQDELSITVPGAEGYFGVLPGHTPLISLLQPGTLTVMGTDKKNNLYAVAGGYAAVLPDRVTILADRAIPVAEIDPDQARGEQQEAENELAKLMADDSQSLYWSRRRDFAAICLQLHGVKQLHAVKQ